MDKETLNNIIKRHGLWLLDANCGECANLRYADLYGADLRGADLRNANLCDANLRDADLCDANLYGANLRDADLYGADLRGADLRNANLCDANLSYANLCDAVGNMEEIKSMQIDKYAITMTKDIMQIGCKRYTHEEWLNFSDEEISRMDTGALEWWCKYKAIIKQIIEISF